jgi:hypothetical protein
MMSREAREENEGGMDIFDFTTGGGSTAPSVTTPLWNLNNN